MEPTIIDEFRQGLTQIRSGVEQTQHELSDLNTALKEVQRDNEETRLLLPEIRLRAAPLLRLQAEQHVMRRAEPRRDRHCCSVRRDH